MQGRKDSSACNPGYAFSALFHSSFQTARLARTFQNLICQGSRFGRPLRQDLIDVTRIRGKFGALFPGVGKIIPIILKQRLF